MTDLQINIALAQALGWMPASKYAIMYDQFSVIGQLVLCNKDGVLRRFDYRTPVLFTAICNHWQLAIDYKYMTSVYSETTPAVFIQRKDGLCVERAAALCVIDAQRRKT